MTSFLNRFDFKLLNEIGRGTYATVYKAIDCRHNRHVAIKCMRLDSEYSGLLCVVIREVNVLRELKHPNIVELLEIVRNNEEIYLVFELMSTDLHRYMINVNQPLSDMQAKLYFYQILKGLEYCHSQKIFHRDLKPQNLLLDPSGNLKIADFGLARDTSIQNRVYSREIITLWYRPPEILLGVEQYTTTVDLWSAGCIFAEMLRNSPLFKGDSEICQLLCIFRILGTPDENIWPGITALPHYKLEFPQWNETSLKNYTPSMNDDAIDIMTRCLRYAPDQRLTATEAIKHNYFNDIR
ncbi:unnamed protein product [Didymodactylos carnosus]|uniref:cyclin-dependent kinase n=1 Tax=Didymodactylos carnosus TaxID=1234261 RepID=A0A814FJT9_9BILA|nr:unnamed protein product [Didymodactylos carnosus]CAF0983951.1 unnamed protein product [Didymodactylos carnosus]CAF3667093.1 unnamed protein product [Didymodactylos carnosus]CAF3756303.1 unnamed protein product [Didymodactylos carnosus]